MNEQAKPKQSEKRPPGFYCSNPACGGRVPAEQVNRKNMTHTSCGSPVEVEAGASSGVGSALNQQLRQRIEDLELGNSQLQEQVEAYRGRLITAGLESDQAPVADGEVEPAPRKKGGR